MKAAFIFSEDYLKYQFGPSHPFKPIRCRLTLEALKRIGAFEGGAELIAPAPATEEDLLQVHAKEYIEYVRIRCQDGTGFLDYGDTPAVEGLFEGACAIVGGSILGADLIASGSFNHAFNVGGGLHHAKPDAASGFCVFNDIAIAVRRLQRKHGLNRIVILDIDGHHGDGTQEIFYREPILKISTHRIGIFPGTGYVDELGEGEGLGYSVNIPLPANTGDGAYIHAFTEVIQPLIEWNRPEAILCQFGVDGHLGDPLVGMALTTKTYAYVASSLHSLAHRLCEGRLLLFGGGGYLVDVASRCWALMFLIVSDATGPEAYKELIDTEVMNENEAAAARVRATVDDVKRRVFTIHGIR